MVTVKNFDWVAFYGCTNRVVKLGWTGNFKRGNHHCDYSEIKDALVRPGYIDNFPCPACGYEHRVTLMWRQRKDKETVEMELTK